MQKPANFCMFFNPIFVRIFPTKYKYIIEYQYIIFYFGEAKFLLTSYIIYYTPYGQ